jgi:signal transduction histidine kinase/ligand-binding sensor domain-containing protein
VERASILWKACVASVFLSGRIFGLEPVFPLDTYLHAAWTQADTGPIRNVLAIAQTTDGFLWIATSSGLLRFDGMRFVSWNVPAGETTTVGPINALCGSSDGSLWIGTASGVIRVFKGHITKFATREGLPEGRIGIVKQDSQGNILVATRGAGRSGVARIDPIAGSVQRITERLTDPNVMAIHEDRQGRLWIGTETGICGYSRSAGCWMSAAVGVRSIAEDSDGNLFILASSNKGVVVLHAGSESVKRAEEFGFVTGSAIVRDRDGNMWIGTAGRGVLRWRNGAIESFMRRNGLTGEEVSALLEDREGNVWVGTNGGLDRFRPPLITRLPIPGELSAGLGTVVISRRNGDIWIGTVGEGLVMVRKDAARRIASGLPGRTITALHEDASGRTWVGTTGGLGYIDENDKFIPFAQNGVQLNRVFAMTSGRDGVLWLVDANHGVFSLKEGGLNSLQRRLPRTDVYQIHAGIDGTLWLGYYGGGLTAISRQAVQTWEPRDGLAGGPVQAIKDDPNGTLWIGTTTGLSRRRANHWTTWTSEQGLPSGGVWDILSDGSGGLWLMTGSGLVNMRESALDSALAREHQPIQFTILGPSDGITFAWSGRTFNPRAVTTPDGSLLVASENWVVRVNQNRLSTATAPPNVVIEQVRVDQKEITGNLSGDIAINGSQLEFVYTSPYPAAPEHVQFRYKMEGIDTEWKMAGSTRRLTYAGLGAGHYRFLVTARNNGPWNAVPANFDFRIEPALHERAWFRAILLLTLLALAGALYQFRLHQVQARMQLVHQERLRLTRELHDTLLQGFAGVVYQLEAATRQAVSAPELSRKLLEKAVQNADCALSEARQAIFALRLPALENHTLSEALVLALRQLTEGVSVASIFRVDDRANMLPYDIRANLYLICREAVTNAVNHAKPRKVAVELICKGNYYRLVVRDDGIGFDPQQKAPEGHLGLEAMRERSKKIGAELTITSSPEEGTRVEIICANGANRSGLLNRGGLGREFFGARDWHG